MTPDRTFPSRVDAWLVALFLGAATLPLAAAIWNGAAGNGRGVLLLGSWGVAMLIAILIFAYPLRYTLAKDRLRIKCGVLDSEVPYAAINRVRLSNNPLSAPAWSLRRVRIDHTGGGFILVSPDDREVFIEEIARRCPHLVRVGAGLEFRPPNP